MPPEIQDGASNGYYRQAALDGSRPAIYFINLKTTGDWPKYSLPALTYHEGVPGHHLQISLAQNAGDMPMLRRIAFYSAYGEGWALYAEQVADELGAYKGIERAGYLQSFLFRAERLVVDTGLNHKRWTREQAIDHMVADDRLRPPARPARDRALLRLARPGLQLQDRPHRLDARPRQGAAGARATSFDLSDFHDILKEGAMPLTILERRVDERIAARLARASAPELSAISATSSQRCSAASFSARWSGDRVRSARRNAADRGRRDRGRAAPPRRRRSRASSRSISPGSRSRSRWSL